MTIYMARIQDRQDSQFPHREVADAKIRWVRLRWDSDGQNFLEACWNLGYAVLNLGTVEDWEAARKAGTDFGYRIPPMYAVPFVADLEGHRAMNFVYDVSGDDND